MISTTRQRGYALTDTDTTLTDSANDSQYVLRVRDLETEDKPREKMLQSGSTGLTMAELVAVIWGTGTRKEEVMTMAQRLLREYGEQAILHETQPQKLSELLDIPTVKACQIVACLEIGRRYYQQKNAKPVYVRTAEQAYEYLAGIARSQKEQLRGIYLNSRYQVIHDEIISMGSLTANIVHPREVFQPALERGAVAVIVAHNHPSGDVTPTSADREVTQVLREAGNILGVELLDHLIIAEKSYCSIMEHKGDTK